MQGTTKLRDRAEHSGRDWNDDDQAEQLTMQGEATDRAEQDAKDREDHHLDQTEHHCREGEVPQPYDGQGQPEQQRQEITQKVRQSPTIQGAVARYVSIPIGISSVPPLTICMQGTNQPRDRAEHHGRDWEADEPLRPPDQAEQRGRHWKEAERLKPPNGQAEQKPNSGNITDQAEQTGRNMTQLLRPPIALVSTKKSQEHGLDCD